MNTEFNTWDDMVAEIESRYSKLSQSTRDEMAGLLAGVKNDGLAVGKYKAGYKAIGQAIAHISNPRPAPVAPAVVAVENATLAIQPTPAGNIIVTDNAPRKQRKPRTQAPTPVTVQAVQAVQTQAPVEPTPAFVTVQMLDDKFAQLLQALKGS